MSLPVLRLYTDLAFRSGADDSRLVPWLRFRAAPGPQARWTPKQRVWQEQWLEAEDPTSADWWVLPDRWAAYLEQGRVDRALAFARAAAAQEKLVLVWCGGDEEFLIPFENAIVVQAGTYRGLARTARHALELPVFVDDLVEETGTPWAPAPFTPEPVVGFCGLARARPRSRLGFQVRTLRTRLAAGLGRATTRPSPHGFATDLRTRILDALAAEEGVQTNFVIRDRYKAGQGRAEVTPAEARRAFLANIQESAYTVCVRGGGNFSKRLYETLCLGRIPLLLDTHTALPFEEFLDWSHIVVRVPLDRLEEAGDILREAHARFTPASFAARQKACRSFWQEHLSAVGYYRTFPRYRDLIRSS